MANKLYDIEDSQSGKIYTIEGPEGATAEELGSFISSQGAQTPQATPAPAPTSVAVTTPDAAPKTPEENIIVNGLPGEQKRLSPVGESAVAEAAANPRISWNDY